MAQTTTWPIPSGPSGLAMRQQVNLITEALRTSNSGATAPTPTVAGMLWFDTSTTPGVLKQRNSANDDWVAVVPVSGRNLIINGSGRINQLGYSSGTATGSDNEFALDQWFVRLTGQNLTFTGTDAGRTMTAPAGGVSQVIDGPNVAGGTYVINWTGTATCTVNGTSRAKGDTFTLGANTNVIVIFSSGTFTNVQLELGTVPTVFERIDRGSELAICQQYAWVPDATDRLWLMAADNNGLARSVSVPFPRTMRAAPLVTYTLAFGTASELDVTKDRFILSANAANAESSNSVIITLVQARQTS